MEHVGAQYGASITCQSPNGDPGRKGEEHRLRPPDALVHHASLRHSPSEPEMHPSIEAGSMLPSSLVRSASIMHADLTAARGSTFPSVDSSTDLEEKSSTEQQEASNRVSPDSLELLLPRLRLQAEDGGVWPVAGGPRQALPRRQLEENEWVQDDSVGRASWVYYELADYSSIDTLPPPYEERRRDDERPWGTSTYTTSDDHVDMLT